MNEVLVTLGTDTVSGLLAVVTLGAGTAGGGLTAGTLGTLRVRDRDWSTVTGTLGDCTVSPGGGLSLLVIDCCECCRLVSSVTPRVRYSLSAGAVAVSIAVVSASMAQPMSSLAL